MIERIAEDAGHHVACNVLSEGGMNLHAHYFGEQALDLIASKPWDYVVLQEQSTLPIENFKAFSDAVYRFNHAIINNASKTVLYATWARENIPGMFQDLNTAYDKVAQSIDAIKTPVGLAWDVAIEANPGLKLYEKDKSHPSLIGSYLTACVFACQLLDMSPENIPSRIEIIDGVFLEFETDIINTLIHSVKIALHT